MRKMSEEDSTVIYVTRPLWGTQPVDCIDEYLKKIGTPMHYGSTKFIERDGNGLAVCNTFCVDGYVERTRLLRMFDNAGLSDRCYIEIWSEIADQNLTEHVFWECDGKHWVYSGYECFTTSEHPDVTPEYLTEDYAVAFICGQTTGLVLDTCSFTCRKW